VTGVGRPRAKATRGQLETVSGFAGNCGKPTFLVERFNCRVNLVDHALRFDATGGKEVVDDVTVEAES